MAQKKLSRTRQKIHDVYEENELASIKQNQTRARSFTLGTANGGVVEINMRGDFSSLWFQMQPTEAVEIIGQLAAAVGVEVAMRPRNDFSSWRSWDPSLPASVQWMGSAPWQLTDEQRLELEAAKSKNIKTIESSDEPE